MRLQELIETTEEDRGLISLSSSIADALRQYEGDSEETSPDYDPDYDPEIYGDRGEIDEPITVGRIGDFLDTPFEVLNNITIELQSNFGLRKRKSNVNTPDRGPLTGIIKGMWDGNTSSIVLNKDYIGTNSIRSTIAHELRHALDDYKSEFQANKEKGRYSIPKKKEHRKAKDEDDMTPYHAEPGEINSRFIQVLHDLVPVIKRAVKLPPENVNSSIMNAFKKSLEDHNIAYLFPEKERSRDYKRLIKRAMDFIQKELAHVQSTQTK